jgi:predicted Zn-dependent peptidase
MECYTAGFLENGLGFLIAPRPGTHLVHLALYINHGVKDEAQAENGLSHLLEHVLFNTNRFPPALAKLFEPLARQGTQMEAWTSKEYTRLCLSFSPTQLGATLCFLRELLQKAPLREETLRHEKKIVLDEIARKRASNNYLWSIFEEALFAPPYGMPVLGQPNTVEGLSLSLLKRRLKDILTPERIRLVLTGRVDATCSNLIGEWFHDWGTEGRFEPSSPVELVPRLIALPSNSPRVGLYLGFPAPGLTDSERPAVETLAQILGFGLRSRVFRALREEAGLAYAVGGGSVHWRLTGYIYLAAEVARDRLTETFTRLMGAINELKSTSFELSEVHEARQSLSLRTLSEAEGPGLASRLGLHWLAGEVYYPTRAAAGFRNIKLELVNKATSYLNIQQMAIVGVGTSEQELNNLLEVAS